MKCKIIYFENALIKFNYFYMKIIQSIFTQQKYPDIEILFVLNLTEVHTENHAPLYRLTRIYHFVSYAHAHICLFVWWYVSL